MKKKKKKSTGQRSLRQIYEAHIEDLKQRRRTAVYTPHTWFDDEIDLYEQKLAAL